MSYPRERDVVDHGGAGLAEDVERGVEDGDRRREVLDAAEVDEVARHADALAFQGAELAGVDVVGDATVGEGNGGCVVVVGIRAGDGRENLCGVFDGARHGPDGVLVLGDGDHEVPRREAD